MPITVSAYVPNVAPGAYQAVCTNVEDKAARDDPSNVFRVWEFTLRDGSGRTVSASSSLATTPKSKGGKWLAALIGRVPEVGEVIDPIGKACTIVVAIKDTTGYEYVETVAAPMQAPAQSPVRPNAVQDPTAPLTVSEQEAEPSPNDPLPF